MLLTPVVYLVTTICKVNNWSTQCVKRLVEAGDLNMLTGHFLKNILKNDESKGKHSCQKNQFKERISQITEIPEH